MQDIKAQTARGVLLDGALFKCVNAGMCKCGSATASATLPGSAGEMACDRSGANALTHSNTNTIDDVVAAFGDAARRAEQAGYDGVQIHAAHFFYLSRFISPLFNHRTDRYSGARILPAILADMRSKTSADFLITIKINSTDGYPGGMSEEGFIAACKLKNSKTNGVCAIRDDLRPVLERARQCDVLMLGSPVYYSYPTGDLRSFMERLMFPVGTYMYELTGCDGHEGRKHITLRDKVIPTAMIFTMNCPEDYMKQIGYPTLLEENTKVMEDIFGYSETLYACNTYQFNDYSRYDFNLFSEEDKHRYRDDHWQTDLQNAFDLGKRLVEKATEV